MVRKLAMDGLSLKEDIMKVNSKMANLMVEEFITSLILVKFMMANSKRTIWMAKDLWFGQTSQDMKEILKWVK